MMALNQQGLTNGALFFILDAIFRGSSVVEQVTVNHLVVGSNPPPGAKEKADSTLAVFSFTNTGCSVHCIHAPFCCCP